MRAAVVVVGDEILSGHVRDENAHFIAGRLATHGHLLARISIVGDDPGLIAREVSGILDRDAPDVLFVCGGLGPTHDDRTMEGIASALGRKLEPCEGIAERIDALVAHLKKERFSADPLGIEGLRKMAMAPAGAEAIRCSAGLIPAVTLTEGAVRIVVLPGPPSELRTVFRDAVEPVYLEGTGDILAAEEIEHPFPESALAACLVALSAEFPEVKIGSYPGSKSVLVRVGGREPHVGIVAARVRAAIGELAASDDGRRLLELVRERRARRSGETEGGDLPRPEREGDDTL